jgi:hypothetical protein
MYLSSRRCPPQSPAGGPAATAASPPRNKLLGRGLSHYLSLDVFITMNGDTREHLWDTFSHGKSSRPLPMSGESAVCLHRGAGQGQLHQPGSVPSRRP